MEDIKRKPAVRIARDNPPTGFENPRHLGSKLQPLLIVIRRYMVRRALHSNMWKDTAAENTVENLLSKWHTLSIRHHQPFRIPSPLPGSGADTVVDSVRIEPGIAESIHVCSNAAPQGEYSRSTIPEELTKQWNIVLVDGSMVCDLLTEHHLFSAIHIVAFAEDQVG
jgi:hypothetical protein